MLILTTEEGLTEALPPGLLPRLIARTHELSEAHAEWRWRSGVVLEWVGARALVRLDRNERRTEVTGDVAEDCQSLFDIIRAHLTVLHGKVPVIEEVQALDDPEKWEPRLRKLQCATREAKCVYHFEPPQLGWMEVEQAIRRAVEARRKSAR